MNNTISSYACIIRRVKKRENKTYHTTETL